MFINNLLRRVFYTINCHIILLLVLFLIQSVFFVSLAYVNVVYQTELLQNLQSIIVPLQQANYDETAIKTGIPFVQNAAGLYESYQSALGNIEKLVSYQFLAFLFVFLFGFALTHRLFGKKNVFVVWIHLAARALVFLVPFFLIAYYIVNQALSVAVAENTAGAQWLIYTLFGLTLLLTYFMLVCLALPVQPLFRALRRCFSLGLFRAHYLLAILLFNGAVLFGFGWLLATAVQEWAFWIMVVLLIIFVLGFIVARVVFFSAVRVLLSSD